MEGDILNLITLPMGYTQNGMFLSSPYRNHRQLSTSYLQNIKRGQEKMLNVHLGSYNPVFTFCIVRHVCMNKGTFRVSC
jgi:hypothetical protein